MVRRHPLLSSVQVPYRGEGVLVELVCYRGECWAGADDAGCSVCMRSGGFADGESRVGVEVGDGVSPQCAVVCVGCGWLARHYGL